MVMPTVSAPCFFRRCALTSRCRSSLTRRSRLLIGIPISDLRFTNTSETVAEWLRKGDFLEFVSRKSQRSAHLLDFEALDLVAGLVAVVAVEADTALEAGAH